MSVPLEPDRLSLGDLESIDLESDHLESDLMEMMRMQRFTFLTAFQRAAALVLAAIMVPAGWAQDASSVPSAPSAQMPAQKAVPSSSQPFDVKEYSKPQSHFPNPIGPYTAAPRSAAEPGQHAAHRPTHARRQTLHLHERRGRAGARK